MNLHATGRSELGQFFTPPPVAAFLASLFQLKDGPAKLLDPGAGVGSLTAAFVARWLAKARGPLQITACEVDQDLGPQLKDTLADCVQGVGLQAEIFDRDFIDWAITSGLHPTGQRYDYIIMNPPYRKLAAKSWERSSLSKLGIEAPNLYAAFVGLAIRLLAPEGQLVAITPRSFANGPYFKAFRQDLLSRVSLRHIHVYELRDKAFADAKVLQENVIFLISNGTPSSSVTISSSPSPLSDITVSRAVPYREVVKPDDPDSFIHLTPDADDAQIARRLSRLPATIQSLGLSVSTGRVVDFRTASNLRSSPENSTVPLVYPTHMTQGRVLWPRAGKKPNALCLNQDTRPLLLPEGWYVLVKRFSSKEERRRIVASVVCPDDLPGSLWAFENHLNVYHDQNVGLSPLIAIGICAWLNSTPVDIAFRQFSGHTQVNATDLRSLRYPSQDELLTLGQAAIDKLSDQRALDRLVSSTVKGLED